MKRNTLIIMALSLVLVLGLAMQAVADPISGLTISSEAYSLITVPKGDGTFNTTSAPPPYARVDVFVYSNNIASIEFTALDSYFLGDIAGLNVTTAATGGATPIATLAGFSGPFPNAAPIFSATQPTNTPNSIDNPGGFGSFNLNWAFDGGFSNAFKDVSFTLSGDYTGISAADVLVFNAAGYDAYTHIFLQDTPGGTVATLTGFAGENTPTVPIPPSALLLGSGLMGLGLIGWRPRKS